MRQQMSSILHFENVPCMWVLPTVKHKANNIMNLNSCRSLGVKSKACLLTPTSYQWERFYTYKAAIRVLVVNTIYLNVWMDSFVHQFTQKMVTCTKYDVASRVT